MAKLTLNDIASGYASVTKINDNNTAIETAFENTLSRDGTSPNAMNAELDMNSHKITNLAAPVASTDAARLVDITGGYTFQAAPSAVGQAGKGLVSNGTTLVYSTVLTGLSSLDASQLLTGTVPDGRFPATLPAVSGLNLTNINATNIASGTLAAARLPSNVALKDAITNFTVSLQVGSQDVGYRDIVAVAASASYSITSSDRGKLIINSSTGGFTLPVTAADSVFSNGAAVSICNTNVSSVVITCPAGITLFIAGTAVGGAATNRNLATRGLATLVRIGVASWLISGSGVT